MALAIGNWSKIHGVMISGDAIQLAIGKNMGSIHVASLWMEGDVSSELQFAAEEATYRLWNKERD